MPPPGSPWAGPQAGPLHTREIERKCAQRGAGGGGCERAGTGAEVGRADGSTRDSPSHVGRGVGASAGAVVVAHQRDPSFKKAMGRVPRRARRGANESCAHTKCAEQEWRTWRLSRDSRCDRTRAGPGGGAQDGSGQLGGGGYKKDKNCMVHPNRYGLQ